LLEIIVNCVVDLFLVLNCGALAHAEEKREILGWKVILESTLKKQTFGGGGCINWIHLAERGKWQCAVHMIKKLQIPQYAGIFLFS